MAKQSSKSREKNHGTKSISCKAQEEMLGFMLIVIIVAIIGIVFLFFVKPKPTVEKSMQIDNLLYSVLSYTAGEKTIRDIIELCYENNDFEGQNACSYLEKELKIIIDTTLEKSSLVVGKQLSGYSLNITDMIDIGSGELKGNVIGSYVPVKAGIDTSVILTFYY